MWLYSQSTGFLCDDSGTRQAIGYSGAGQGKNNPDMQAVHNVGPIPCGLYVLGMPIEKTEEHGPFVIPLTPDPDNEMFGRGGFLVHGDSISHPGTASEGCIIVDLHTRQKIWQSDDHLLKVVP